LHGGGADKSKEAQRNEDGEKNEQAPSKYEAKDHNRLRASTAP
jgi:hypothetical protein